jgi:glucokinase
MIADFVGRAARMRRAFEGVSAVGVSIGGPMNPLTGVVISPPHLPGWEMVPLAERLRKELGMPATVEHDAAACLEAEWLWGAARGAANAAYLTSGTGCGAGIMIAGRIVRGPAGETPEVGHVRLAPDGPEGFGKRGSVESFCSGTGIARLAPYMFPGRWTEPVAAEHLRELADSGDADARAVLEESARRTGQLVAMLADIFAPSVVIMGSLARYLGGEWRRLVEESFRDEALEENSKDTRLVLPELGERLQDLSAAAPVVFRGRGGE